jgi:hypothetical protein
MIDAFIEAHRALDPQTLAEIAEVNIELQSAGYPECWSVFIAECRICCHEETCICPTAADFDEMECGNCGAMAAQPQEISEWEQANWGETEWTGETYNDEH